ncbi:DUF2271 domain-containing protein [Echinicola sp. 20G]|uniref:DUF2271 domain-containing protein n=1 Tax=Echinicola sp. 20G TaxID=2781961 RepID=UPI0019110080|nr:DUF2271 domain-containing protein [Echinicola sp. 20G]
MKIWKKVLLGVIFVCMAILGHAASPTKYKCLVQMTNYVGEGAYITVSLIGPEGNYLKTLSVLGEDTKWYDTLEKWYGFYKKSGQKIDGITGASVSGGARTVLAFELNEEVINKGYKLRFESAVENNQYHQKDVEVKLNESDMSGQIDGQGYIRFVRILQVK